MPSSDAKGDLCAQAAHIPVHLGSMAYAMGGIVRQMTWREGEMVVVNDPFLGGTHLPDVTVIAPLFVSGLLVAFVDGSVQFISGTTDLAVLLRIAFRDDGQTVKLN